MERVQTLVIGAGVVGLACARALARRGREVVVVEAAGSIGTGTSSRNSEVVHAGIYYPAGSRKALHCVRGAAALKRFCAERGVAHRVCGKLIVATSAEQRGDLEKISTHAARNGVKLEPLGADAVRDLEPEVACVAALLSPGTAIVDSHGFLEALQADAEDAGAALAFRSRVLAGGRLLPEGGAEVVVESSGASDAAEVCRFQAQEVVNCAGLAAPAVATALGVPGANVPTPYFCRGSYYALLGFGPGKPFSRLVYPVPEKNTSGLGIHATVDLSGAVRFGPDVEWLPDTLPCGRRVDAVAYDDRGAAGAYAVDTSRAQSFYAEVRRYWPGLPDGALEADYSGIRPKLSAPGEPAADFHLELAAPGVMSLYGIESPGLTSALSLADEVLERLEATA